MDIRNFFQKKPVNSVKITENEQSTSKTSTKAVTLNSVEPAKKNSEPSTSLQTVNRDETIECDPSSSSNKKRKMEPPVADLNLSSKDIVDIGDLTDYNEVSTLSDAQKYNFLKNPPNPGKSYNFKKDVPTEKRAFRYEWFYQYNCLIYSQKLRGALCKNCVLFRPLVKRGVQGAFVNKVFDRYKNFHEDLKKHITSTSHKEALLKSENFLEIVEGKQKSVDIQINRAADKLIAENKLKLKSIIQTITFCGTHDLALRGKLSNTGNFNDLLEFRVESGDTVLEDHLRNCSGKAKYTSVRIQNELINICGLIIRRDVVEKINSSEVIAFSLLADETADISGIEQLSIGVRYLGKCKDDDSLKIFEDFLGFVKLSALNAESIANTIMDYCKEINLDMTKLKGLGFDGCSTMSGKEGGVQRLIRNQYPSALFFHCSSHKLNLVVNDLNSVRQIQNTIGTVKEVIKFFRESTLRRNLIPNIPLLCETRWSAKYKSIRYFSENFVKLKQVLEELKDNSDVNRATRVRAQQLATCTSDSNFIICLKIIAKYSALLEPVTNILQGINMDMFLVQKHVETLLSMFKKHRNENLDVIFSEIFQQSLEVAETFNIQLNMPRTVNRQNNRANYEANSPEEYFKRSVFINYLDSLIMSMSTRFSEENTSAFLLYSLHPYNMKKHTYNRFIEIVKEINTLYNIENLYEESLAWNHFWINNSLDTKDLDLIALLKFCEFYPAVSKALQIAITLPPTTCSIERSFSTLRRVKTWLRSTMGEERLSGLCVMSVHRESIKTNKDFNTKVLTEFSKNNRNLKFAFSDL